jgi:phosphonate transport system permease protein
MIDSRPRLLEAAYAQAVALKRRQLWLGLVVLAVLVAFSVNIAEISLSKFYQHIGSFFSYFDRIAHLEDGRPVIADPAEWFWGWKKWLALMGETLLMAYLGTLLGAIAAFVLCFLASQNLTQSKGVVFLTRRLLEFSRTVPELVFALIFVVAFSLGPLPGILALAIHSAGALGKLFAEVVENIDMKPVEGVVAAGGNWFHKIRFAVLPQVASNFASYALLRFEINVRGASVLGFVGAGGIGQTLLEVIRKFYYADISALLVMIIATVMIIDAVTERIRHKLIGMDARS